MLQSPDSQSVKIESSFIFQQATIPNNKKPYDRNTKTYLLVNTKPSANEHLPLPKTYKFESCFLSQQFENVANQLRAFKVRKDDVWVIAFPKSGVTWTMNIVWQLKHGLDFSKEPLASSTLTYFERDAFIANYDQLEKLNNTPSPRVIKSHLPLHLLPVDLWNVRPKIIYIARNPKDVAVSTFHMISDKHKCFSGSIEDYFDLFLENHTLFAPQYAHVLAYWKLCSLDNFLFLTYEQLLDDQFDGVKQIAEFLESNYGEDELKQLTEYASFGNMKKLYKPKNDYQ